jgi:hypothetical protein
VTSTVWNRGVVIWQDADEEEFAPEPAILLHQDNGHTIIAEQEGRVITFTTAGALEFAKRLRELVKLSRDGSE